MEFSFEINSLLPDEISVLDRNALKNKLPDSFTKNYPTNFKNQSGFKLKTVIDRLGEASAKAQGLSNQITSALKLVQSSHRLYIIKDAQYKNNLGCVLGLLKVGRKTLFFHDPQGSLIETYPLCVLDFYIHESHQRLGLGHKLFDFALKKEGICAHQLALDRPSEKLLAFMAKHYSLSEFISQVNNFVVFSAFFKGLECPNTKENSKSVQFLEKSNVINNSSEEEPHHRRNHDSPEYSRHYYSPQTKARHRENRRSLPALKGVQESSSWKVLGVPPPEYLH